MTCGRSVKEKYYRSFLTVLFILISPQSRAPKFACSWITRSPIPCSPITLSATLTPQSLFPPNHLLPNRLLAPTHQLLSLQLSNFLPDRLIALPLIFEKNPCTPQLIYPWSILNHPGLLLLIVDLFASLNPDIFIPLTRSLVFCCRHWSSAIKSSSDFRNISLQLHSTIYRPLIYPQLPLSSTVDCQFICIADPRSIAPTDPVPGILLLSLVFCYQIFLWFSKHSLALALHN